jgi:dGTPase
MQWNHCFSGDRFGAENLRSEQRTEYERDWDRIVFSSAFRRLQNKTQVFPLPEEVFVHNRLTHSLEVASVGRSLGSMLGEKLASLPELSGDSEARNFYREHLKSVISSACLAHDLGNPAFGHSGEKAISRYFTDRQGDKAFTGLFSENEWADLISFEGNANALRILTRAFKGRMPGGFRLTYSTLAALVKYPCESQAGNIKNGPVNRKKYGFFQSEIPVFQSVAEKLHIPESHSDKGLSYQRHPFVFLVEAADDICYNIIDLEDAHRLRIFSTEFVTDLLLRIIQLNENEDLNKIKDTLLRLSEDANEAVSYLRAKAINYFTNRCASIFWENREAIISGRMDTGLMARLHEAQPVLKELESVSVKKIYNYPSVVKIELAGFRIMSGLLEDFIPAALKPAGQRQKNEEKLVELIHSQYRFEEGQSPYEKVMCILDYVSGMTDLYALKLYRNLPIISMESLYFCLRNFLPIR